MSSDSELRRAVLGERTWEPSVIAAHIGFTANAGVVARSGHVSGFVQKDGAEAAAGRVKGVRTVAEEPEVRLAFDMTRGDDDIAAAAINCRAWDEPRV